VRLVIPQLIGDCPDCPYFLYRFSPALVQKSFTPRIVGGFSASQSLGPPQDLVKVTEK